jgi:hypothetical protein
LVWRFSFAEFGFFEKGSWQKLPITYNIIPTRN